MGGRTEAFGEGTQIATNQAGMGAGETIVIEVETGMAVEMADGILAETEVETMAETEV